MRYLITTPNDKPFLTNWFDFENFYCEGMTVYDFGKCLYSFDGKTWNEINIDHL